MSELLGSAQSQNHRTQEGFQRTEIQLEVIIRAALRFVRTKLCVKVHRTYALFIADTRTACHVLEGIHASENREHEQFLAVLNRCFLILL